MLHISSGKSYDYGLQNALRYIGIHYKAKWEKNPISRILCKLYNNL